MALENKTREASGPDRRIELPQPTAFPMVTAFGITLLFAGVVTNPAVSVVGLICAIVGGIGWFRDVFPHPRHAWVELSDDELKPIVIESSMRSVKHLAVGKSGHRVRVPVEVHPYTAGVIGGLAGGVAMAVLALLYGLVFKGSIWWPVNLLAAAAVPSLSQADDQVLLSFSLIGLIVAIFIHGIMSVLVGLLYAVMLPMLPKRLEWFWGGIITPLMWTGLIYATLGFIDPALEARIDWLAFIICQVAFGVVGGYVVFKSERVETMQAWPVAEKLGIEAQTQEEKQP